MPIFVQCRTCTASCNVPDGEDPHEYFQCQCCTDDHHHHHHGLNANACPVCPQDKPWSGPMSGPRPDGCTHCRPLIFFGNAAVQPAAGG